MDKSKFDNPYQPVHAPESKILLLTEDASFATYISQQIIHFGYLVQHIRDFDNLNAILGTPNISAVVVDIPRQAKDVKNSIFNKIDALKNAAQRIIFVSDQDDQETRLDAIRAGGAAYFTKPVNILSFIDKLDSLNRSPSNQQPSRVLIIEDQPAVASYYHMILRMYGIDAKIVSKPEVVLDQMQEFHPDLILIDTYLNDMNAADLARVIRQIDTFVSIPIIFLSNEDDFGKRIEVLNLGGDDFLVKPIKASHLMAVVRSRLERSKTLHSLMVRDSLTNLLNHTAFRSSLSQEVLRCQRQNATLALAMLDIDNFKSINDTYGHAAGDSALKALARLLQQRLRKSDIIGRYGGDEFVALLLDCESDQALFIIDEIRVHYSDIEFYPNQSQPLSLTFSCGISTFPRYQSVESLSDSADQALYLAKAGQRNRTVIAVP
jgi:diguanylate cyclase (GGDEF)-like protein